MDVLIFSQLASMSPFLFATELQFTFSACFDFAMHYGSLYCPFKVLGISSYLAKQTSLISKFTGSS